MLLERALDEGLFVYLYSVMILICLESKTFGGKFLSRISSRRPPRIFCPTDHPLACLALGFLARCGAGFSPALHRAPHPACGLILPGLRSHPGTGGPLRVNLGSAHSSLPGPAYRRAQGRWPGSQALEICARPSLDSHLILTRLAPIRSVPTRIRFAPEFHSTRTRPIVESTRLKGSGPSLTWAPGFGFRAGLAEMIE